jgi:hypothetical protein
MLIASFVNLFLISALENINFYGFFVVLSKDVQFFLKNFCFIIHFRFNVIFSVDLIHFSYF